MHSEKRWSNQDLLDTFGVTFVTGAIYLADNDKYYEAARTGNYTIVDAYELDDKLNRVHNYTDTLTESAIIESMGFMEEARATLEIE